MRSLLHSGTVMGKTEFTDTSNSSLWYARPASEVHRHVRSMSKPTDRKLARRSSKSRATAPGQCLGYGLQYTRLTAMLLTATEGSACSLEVLDDVASENTSGRNHLVQTKSALGANPVADRAESLWKTFYNWLELIRRGTDVKSTTFEIYVSRPAHGNIVCAFSNANSVEDAANSIEQAKTILWGDSPDYARKAALSDSTATYINYFFEADVNITSQLVKNFNLHCGSGSPQEDIDAIIRGHPVSPSKVDDIATHMCGWVKRSVDKRLEASLPAVLSRDDFHCKYTAYCRSVDRETILKSYSTLPTQEETVARLPDIFVQQLDLIELTFDEKLAAVSDFLMACSDRTKWSKKLEVDETSFDELDKVLTRTWKNFEKATSIRHRNSTEIERGQLLYLDCSSHKAQLQGMSVPDHFVPGCFHRLSDEQTVGWHPNYRTMLKEGAHVTTA